MSWSYDVDDLSTSELFQVRLLIRDTDTTRQLFQDEEIDWILTQEANIYTSSAALCEQLVTRAGGIKSKKIDGLAIVYDVGFYRSLAAQLRARGSGHQVPYASGISISDKQTQAADSDAVKPSIFRRLGDNPGAPSVARPGNNNDSDPLTTI